MNRFYRRFTKAVTKPWQMYPLGAPLRARLRHRDRGRAARPRAGAAGAGLPFYAILCLPILFAAGMSPARHDRRRVHELRLRLGLLEAGAEGLLQHDDHRALGRRRAGDRHDRADRGALREAQPHRRQPGTSAPTSTSTTSATRSSRSSCSPGPWRWPIWHFGRIEERWSAALQDSETACDRPGLRHSSVPMTDPAQARRAAFEDIDEVYGALRAEGHRVSTACRLVLEALFAADGPDLRAVHRRGALAGRRPRAQLRLSKPRAPREPRRRQARPPRPRPEPLHAGRRRREGVPALRALRPVRSVDPARARPGPGPDPAAVRIPGPLRPLPDRRPLRSL